MASLSAAAGAAPLDPRARENVGSALADGIVGVERRSFADDPVR